MILKTLLKRKFPHLSDSLFTVVLFAATCCGLVGALIETLFRVPDQGPSFTVKLGAAVLLIIGIAALLWL